MKKLLLIATIAIAAVTKHTHSSSLNERVKDLQSQNEALLDMLNEKKHGSTIRYIAKGFLREIWDILKSHLKSWYMFFTAILVVLAVTGNLEPIARGLVMWITKNREEED